MANRRQKKDREIRESAKTPPGPRFTRKAKVEDWFSSIEETTLRHVFSWIASCGASPTGAMLARQYLFGRPVRSCTRCLGTGFVGGSASELPGVEDALGDEQCASCLGSGVISVNLWSNPIPLWYAIPSPECPDGIRNCSGAASWTEEVQPKGSSVESEVDKYDPDPGAYAWMGLQLSRLLRVERSHGVVLVSVLQSWYGPEARNYDPGEVHLAQDDALWVLEQAVVDGELAVPGCITERELSKILSDRLKAYSTEWQTRKEAERLDAKDPGFSREASEIDKLLLPARLKRAEYLGRIAKLTDLWPATRTGKKELRKISGISGLREYVVTRKGGTTLARKMDVEAERLLRRAQKAWLDTTRVRCEVATPEEAKIIWQDEWAKLSKLPEISSRLETIRREIAEVAA